MIDKCYSNSQISNLIDEYVHSERNRKILKARYIDGLTYEKIAEKFNLSTRYCQTIVYKNETSIFKHLT